MAELVTGKILLDLDDVNGQHSDKELYKHIFFLGATDFN